ncbi:MAG: UvrD-helicase domain-containing protein [Desulfobacterales bacterium]
MPESSGKPSLPDAEGRLTALTDHDHTYLVEAGAGSGKTALLAGRVTLLIAGGAAPRSIVAITFTEAAAAELLERIERFVGMLLDEKMPVELHDALPGGLSERQRENLLKGSSVLDEITCTTIHGFSRQLIIPYPVETHIDPGAAIIDPAAAELAYQDLMHAWLSARFGRDRGAEGLGRIPPVPDAGGEDDLFTELLLKSPDETLDLIEKTARFLKLHRTARAPAAAVDASVFERLSEAIAACSSWYSTCGLTECTTAEFIDDMAHLAKVARKAAAGPLNGRHIAELLFHAAPQACKKNDTAFKQWRRKGKWQKAAKVAGKSKAHADSLSARGEALYTACGNAYQAFCEALGTLAFQRFVKEFDALQDLYRTYKHMAALLDFDDLLHHACSLLKENEPVRRALADRYPYILVDEFQDTDPMQAEILWRLAGEGNPELSWQDRTLRPGALFLVGDPKQAIYRFRGADVETYLEAKKAILGHDPGAVIEIFTNFRSQEHIITFVNTHFAGMMDSPSGRTGFKPLTAIRKSGREPCVAVLDIAFDDDLCIDKGPPPVDTVRRLEAAAVARTAASLIGAYPVFDKQSGTLRPAVPSDLALLAPTGTGLWVYERALEMQGIPIATQAGKGFFRRQEVQDLIAVARTVADRRDTLALGALLRGPLVGLTEAEIADEIEALHASGGNHRLHLWTDPALLRHPILKQTLLALQNLARKARQTTPYLLMSEAVEALQVRPLLKARHPRGAERALANVELVLEMSRAFAARGISDFARALWDRWQNADAQTEGRPDAEAEAVSIITVHSAKGLEWPIVIPINAMTRLRSDMNFLYRRRDDSVHFKIFGYPGPDFAAVCREEAEALRRERVRLWYVALTRARDLLLLPDPGERKSDDWFGLLDLDTGTLPVFNTDPYKGKPTPHPEESVNRQDLATWEREAAAIAAFEKHIHWRRPSRHEHVEEPIETAPKVYTDVEAILESAPDEAQPFGISGEADIKGGPQRGMVMHKLIEEVLTGELKDTAPALKSRAVELLDQLGLSDEADPAKGPSSQEIADAVCRTLQLPEIVALRPLLSPELPVYAESSNDRELSLTAGIADAAAVDETGRITGVIDWKSDVNPSPKQVELYRTQVRDYMTATGADRGLILFLTTGRVVRVTK